MSKQSNNRFLGIIIQGDAFGRELGFPTANLDTPKDLIDYKEGVYAGRATVHGKTYDAAIAIREEPWKFEVHLMNYPGHDIYGETLEVEFLGFVSEMIECKTEAELMDKIANDLRLVRLHIHG